MRDSLTNSPSIGAIKHRDRADQQGLNRHTTIVRPSSSSTDTVIVSHPHAFDRESVLVGAPPGERLIKALPGMAVPDACSGIIRVAPYSGRSSNDGIPLARQVHIDGAVRIGAKETAGSPVCSAGQSQGGLEALVAAGRSRLSDDAVHAETHAGDLSRHEIGGTPTEGPAEYPARSPSTYIAQRGRAAKTIVGKPEDSVAPFAAHHSGRLCDAMPRAGGASRELPPTHILPGADTGSFAHEPSDIWEVVAFSSDRWTRPTAAQPTHPGSSGTYLPVEGSSSWPASRSIAPPASTPEEPSRRSTNSNSKS